MEMMYGSGILESKDFNYKRKKNRDVLPGFFYPIIYSPIISNMELKVLLGRMAADAFSASGL